MKGFAQPKNGLYRRVSGKSERPFIAEYKPFVGCMWPFVGPFVGLIGPFVLAGNAFRFGRTNPDQIGPRSAPASTRTTARPNTAGFTLYELMIALAIGAILLTLAAPDMSDFVRNNRIVTVSNDFVANISVTRSEAIKRGVTVIMCRSANPTAANPSCGGTAAQDWSQGWLMYATEGDINERNYVATDTLIRIGPATPSGVRITSDANGNSWLAYNRDASLRESNSAAYAICDDRNESAGRLISIPLSGRPIISKTTTSAATDCTPT